MDDLDLAPVDLVCPDEGRLTKERARPRLDEGLLRGPQAARVTSHGRVVAGGTGMRARGRGGACADPAGLPGRQYARQEGRAWLPHLSGKLREGHQVNAESAHHSLAFRQVIEAVLAEASVWIQQDRGLDLVRITRDAGSRIVGQSSCINRVRRDRTRAPRWPRRPRG